MPKLYEHLILGRNSTVLTSTGWCEKHWREKGEELYNLDVGAKRVKEHEIKDERQVKIMCDECGV